ncbi:DUF4190 domain-containing protein [Microbacterium sp. VKM Ac-2923]|uniref:DUF4190 domain-containing protein n=1 Tax=Microbacterium sp. VKM Ac-2923 TaxID=2929476 RepID=UPI001FB44E63|nr:DUF4190 domain-containing protein [Microbacterium sp. VKM Ac-2923]MCJ1707233.1 DUF4190 domain-containing protein [Microbacterium sp. VKM Ac-2923]
MSDDRTNDPSPYGHTPDSAGPDASSSPSADSAPPAPGSGAPAAPRSDSASAGYPAPPAPAYGAPAAPGADPMSTGYPAPPAPSYGAPAYPAAAYDSSASGSAPQASDQYAGAAYGQQVYGQQAYGAPAYGCGALPRVNPLAIVALVSSLVGLFVIPLIGQIVGIITGHISLKQVKTTGERGRGMALSGVLIGYISLGLGILLIIFIAVMIAATSGTSARYGA